jgi:hypothetical protein
MRWSVIGIVLLMLSIPITTSAEKPKLRCPKITETDVPEDMAGKLFSEGEAAFKKKRYKKALTKFMCSLQIIDHINTVFNIAQVIPLVRDRRQSLEWLHKYVKEHEDSWTTRELKKVIIKLETMMNRKPSWDPESVLHETSLADGT